MNEAQKNTDKEIWRERPGDYYSPSLHVTEDGCGIGIHAGGVVVVKTPKEWIKLTKARREALEEAAEWHDLCAEHCDSTRKEWLSSKVQGHQHRANICRIQKASHKKSAAHFRALANKESTDET